MYIFHTTPRLLLWKFTISHFKNYNYWFQFLWSARVELFIPLTIEPWYVILKYICLKKNKNFLTVLKRHSLHVKIAIKSQIQTHLCHNRWFAILSILCYKRKSKVYFNIGAVTRTLSKSINLVIFLVCWRNEKSQLCNCMIFCIKRTRLFLKFRENHVDFAQTLFSVEIRMRHIWTNCKPYTFHDNLYLVRINKDKYVCTSIYM